MNDRLRERSPGRPPWEPAPMPGWVWMATVGFVGAVTYLSCGATVAVFRFVLRAVTGG